MDARAGLTSVLIVAANSGSDLADCVESVLANSIDVEILIGDNASTDGCVDIVKSKHRDDTRVRIFHNDTNIGFGAGCNRLAPNAHGDLLLILNPDCRLERDTIERLVETLRSDAKIGIVGATIVDDRGQYEPASRRRDPLMRRAIATKLGLSSFDGANIATAATQSLEDVDAVSGALMMIPRALFASIGGFDEGYFLHCEDLDLCRRVRDAGYRVVCANDVRVAHRKGTSGRSRRVFVERHKHRGMWRWFTKFDPAARNPIWRALVWLAIWSHFAVMWPKYAWAQGRVSGNG